MPIHIGWDEIALRLALTIFAGGLLGLNRAERGSTAGLRTTLLVCLAASIAMIQANLLLDTAGWKQDSFVRVDVMRLPLGILTGMGFIGGGAILRDRGKISGVTTAATLWFATVLGLCFGGGQHTLGIAAFALGIVILSVMKRLEARLPKERRGKLAVKIVGEQPTDEEIRAIIEDGAEVDRWSTSLHRKPDHVLRLISCDVHWQGRTAAPTERDFVRRVLEFPGVHAVRWRG